MPRCQATIQVTSFHGFVEAAVRPARTTIAVTRKLVTQCPTHFQTFAARASVPMVAIVFVFAPSMRPIRDLAEGTERVSAGDYSRRLPWFRTMTRFAGVVVQPHAGGFR